MPNQREEAYMLHEDFVKQFNQDNLHIELNKSQTLNLMSSQFAPSEWKYTMKAFSWLAIILVPTGIIDFFFWPFWIPISLIVLALFIGKAVRSTARNVVVKLSLKYREFYKAARNTKAMFVYLKSIK